MSERLREKRATLSTAPPTHAKATEEPEEPKSSFISTAYLERYADALGVEGTRFAGDGGGGGGAGGQPAGGGQGQGGAQGQQAGPVTREHFELVSPLSRSIDNNFKLVPRDRVGGVIEI